MFKLIGGLYDEIKEEYNKGDLGDKLTIIAIAEGTLFLGVPGFIIVSTIVWHLTFWVMSGFPIST